MSVDTKAKRASVAGLALPFMLGVVPDASAPAAWRQASAWSYTGIVAAVAEVPDATTVRISWRDTVRISWRDTVTVSWRDTEVVGR